MHCMQAVAWCVWLVIHSARSRPHLLYLSTPLPLCITHSSSMNVSSELRSCVKVEVAVQGSPSLLVLVDVKQHECVKLGLLVTTGRFFVAALFHCPSPTWLVLFFPSFSIQAQCDCCVFFPSFIHSVYCDVFCLLSFVVVEFLHFTDRPSISVTELTGVYRTIRSRKWVDVFVWPRF